MQGFTQSPFSLSEEARNTGRHHSWNSDLKLRNSRVTFISAGTSTTEDLNPIIQKKKTSDEANESSFQEECREHARASEIPSTKYAVTPEGQMSNLTLNDLESAHLPQAKSEEEADSTSERSSIRRGLRHAKTRDEFFFADLKGAGEPVHTGFAPPIMRRSPSPTRSDSTGELIVFAGRRHSCKKGTQKDTFDARPRDPEEHRNQNELKPSGHRSLLATVIDDPISFRIEEVNILPEQRQPSFSPSDPEKVAGHLNGKSRPTATKFGQRRRGIHGREEPKDEGILDDYVTNLCDRGALEAFDESSMLTQRDLGGSDTTEWQDELDSLTMGRVERYPWTNSEVWDSADLADFDELSTSNEALDSIEQVLSKRERPSGVQYLIIGAGRTVDDARWFPISSLNIAGAEALIQEFEDRLDSNHIRNSSDVSDASLTIDEQVAQDLQEDLHDQEDEKDLEDRRKARMTDEHIARLLSKQEELGLLSSNLMLFDGGDVGTDSEQEVQFDELWERAMIRQAPSRSKRAKKSQSNFPSASVFADVINQDPDNGFDVVNQQRPSLRKRLNGRRGRLLMELSDSELEQSIQTAWEKDRTKKKKRKQEREELRAQGLLGKKNRIDLKAKYSEGISMTDVKKEIRQFLLSSMERYVPSPGLPIINSYNETVCHFHRWLRENAKWCMKLPISSN